MANPVYQGQGQPSSTTNTGWLGSLGAYFGAIAPVYATAPAPATPTAPANVKAASIEGCPLDLEAIAAAVAAGQIAIIVPRSDGGFSIDPDALAAGQIAIVVPRGALTP